MVKNSTTTPLDFIQCCGAFFLMEDKFDYFVAYKWYSDSREGFGNIKFVTNRKMDIDLIREIEQDLNKQKEVGKSIVISWQLF